MGYSPWGHKELDTTEQLTHTHLLQGSTILANKFGGVFLFVLSLPICMLLNFCLIFSC